MCVPVGVCVCVCSGFLGVGVPGAAEVVREAERDRPHLSSIRHPCVWPPSLGGEFRSPRRCSGSWRPPCGQTTLGERGHQFAPPQAMRRDPLLLPLPVVCLLIPCRDPSSAAPQLWLDRGLPIPEPPASLGFPESSVVGACWWASWGRGTPVGAEPCPGWGSGSCDLQVGAGIPQ